MDKHTVRQIFEQIAASLALKGDNPFRIRAFENAAQAIAGFSGDLPEAARTGALTEVGGIGKGTLEVVRELVTVGRSSLLDDLREQVPPGLIEMLRIPGLGVAKVRQIHGALRIDTLAELEAAASDGRIAALPRFGAKTAENIRKGIAFLRRSSEFHLFHHSLAEALTVQRALAALAGVRRAELAGSVRRRREVIRDLDFVVIHDDDARDALVNRLGAAPGVTEFAGKEGAVTLRFASGSVVDVFLATAREFGTTWVRATGATAHWEQLESRARARHVDLGAPYPDEESLYRALGLVWIPPELREGTGEIVAAAAGELPQLLEERDLKGLLHCHSNYSDGTVTIAEWAAAAKSAGYEWIGITDHSESAAYAGGLKAEDVAKQHVEIDAANQQVPEVRVLKGVEADILADGSLDYPPEIRRAFDFVIGSIHSRLGMDEAEMTTRMLKAMDDPCLAVLGHPTGRLLLSRDPYPFDVERVLERAAVRGVAVEVNADPHRLDLDWRQVRRARELGVTISIGADAHSVAGLANVPVGVGIARKGWLEARDVLNTRDAEGFLAYARKRRTA
ncbi:MAG TPA: DNA polymerase/3'-5' exonuclease PolX [Gemmatimonadales bacterium]|nr:DNA polymerase/3'-5' exonuclease PolX [Gemmatimonadales bacterium]